MVGFVCSPTIKAKEEEEPAQPSELKKSIDPTVDFSLPELDDLSLSFADSFLDFDTIKDWIEENPEDPFMDVSKQDPEVVDLVKVEFGGVEKIVVMGEDEFCKETTVEAQVGDGFGKFGNSGCFIEEEMGKVSLDGVSGGSGGVDANGSAKSGEIVGVDVKSGDVVTVKCEDEEKSSEVVITNGNGVKSNNGSKSGEILSDKNETESDPESESASSSSSSSEDEEGEEEEVEEENGEEEEEKEVEEEERDTDVEEGEIKDSFREEMAIWSDEDEDEAGGIVKAGPITSKNELKALPPVPPVNVMLQPYHQALPVGVVLSIIGSQVIVEGVEKHNPLNEGSILWITESRSPLGLVDEIFGPVKNPYYVVRYNSDSEVPAGIQQGTLISFVPEFANHILNNNSLYKKGYDASGENDEELSDEVEFSDDEKEAEYKRMLKMSKRGTNDQNTGSRKKDKKKFKNRGGNWKNDQSSGMQLRASVVQPPLDQDQHIVPPVAASLDHGNCSRSSGPVQDFTGRTTFPQLVQAPGFTAPNTGVWTNGIPFQQPQNTGFPIVFPTNGIPWLPQNHPQQPYQMPLLNGVQFQHQFNASQMLPSNFVLPGGQTNFGTGPVFAHWPAGIGQNGFNQSQVGMGLQGQHAAPFMNTGQGAPPNGFQMEHNTGIPPSSVLPGNAEGAQNLNQGTHFGSGRKPYRGGGGGRFRGGRGRQQSK